MITTRDLVSFLKSATVTSGFVDSLKVHYRPLICPFDDLLNWVGSKQLKVFDIGCGSGQFALLLAHFTRVTSIYGIEIDQRLVANATRLLEAYSPQIRIKFNVFDGVILPEELVDFDAVFLIDVLHHVPKLNQYDFLKQVYLRMKPGAYFVIKDIDAGSGLVWFNKLHDLIFSHEIGNEWSLARLSVAVQEMGFKIEYSVKKRLYGYPHFTLVLKK